MIFELPLEGYQIGLNWLGKFAQVIIEGVGSIGFGIIMFTLVLKAITLPFDIYQRVKMRKQNLVMKQMQPELEKLQKQYANDKTTYNQKMMELYKKNGYSMFGACLPMILSLIILIVAFQGFRTYSQYANLSMYEKMSHVYNAAILDYAPDGVDYTLAKTAEEVNEEQHIVLYEEDKQWEENGNLYHFDTLQITTGEETQNLRCLEVKSTDANKFIWYYYSLELNYVEKHYKIDDAKMQNVPAFKEATEAFIDAKIKEKAEAKLKAENKDFDKLPKEEKETAIQNAFGELNTEANRKEYYEEACRKGVVKIGGEAVRDWYNAGNDAHFLWVKNVWYPDVSYNHPIQKDYNKFKKELNQKVTVRRGEEKERLELASVLTPTQYENITSELSEAKSQPNGYFILIILSIGFMVLSQFVSMRSSKESNKYQTVDGQGARTQKIMMIVMPLIYAIFAFMYSAAFSIYMTMSSVISLAVTLLSNLIIGRVFRKKEQAAETARVTRKYEWQKTEKEKKQEQKQREKENKKNRKFKK